VLGVVALASGVFAADPAVFVGFLQIGPVDIHKKRRLAGELSGFSPKKASNSPCFVDAGATTPAVLPRGEKHIDLALNPGTRDIRREQSAQRLSVSLMDGQELSKRNEHLAQVAERDCSSS
jgi:hypothetical protein